ncbi:MAG: hypothetical protein RIR48_330, partial [Bacteroidota bacterium]
MKQSSLSNLLVFIIAYFLIQQLSLHAQTVKTAVADDTHLIANASFETGNLEGWKHWSTRYATITNDAYTGQYAVKI